MSSSLNNRSRTRGQDSQKLRNPKIDLFGIAPEIKTVVRIVIPLSVKNLTTFGRPDIIGNKIVSEHRIRPIKIGEIVSYRNKVLEEYFLFHCDPPMEKLRIGGAFPLLWAVIDLCVKIGQSVVLDLD